MMIEMYDPEESREPGEIIEGLDLIRALAFIRAELARKPEPDIVPAEMKVKDIHIAVTVFQPRTLAGNFSDDYDHVRALRDAIGTKENPKKLDPVLIWWAGFGWVVVDGHHRLQAYKDAGLEDFSIDVVRASCDLDEARARSVSENSKNRLIMERDDKLNSAWKLVLTSKLSRPQIAISCGVGLGTVDNMRKKEKEIAARRGALGPDQGQERTRLSVERLVTLRWKKVTGSTVDELMGEEPQPMGMAEREARLQEQTERLGKDLKRVVGKDVPLRNPEVLARALHWLDKRIPGRLINTAAWAKLMEQWAQDQGFELPDPEF
jgi:ParB-like chromosome segregation protein Spo0J